MNAGCEKTTAFKMAGTSLRLHIETEDREYPSMYKLKLQGKDLENVPAELFTLRELEVLCMSPDRQSSLNYKLCNVPPEIGYLTRLRILLLDTNDLHNLPAEIGSLTRLEKLSVSNNRIRQLPPTIADLKNLHTLHLANNQFSEFPAPILQLENLKFLDMCSNQLRVLPPAIGNLKNLETLLLFDNQLSELPEEFGELTRLRCLWLGDNFLQSLPKSITKLEHLMWTPLLCPTATVDGNPLVNPPAKTAATHPNEKIHEQSERIKIQRMSSLVVCAERFETTFNEVLENEEKLANCGALKSSERNTGPNVDPIVQVTSE